MHSLAAPAGHSSHSTPRPSLEGPGRRLAELLAALADADGEQSHAGLPAGGASGAPKERVGSMIAARVDDQIGAGGLDGDAAWDGLPEDGYLPHPVDDAPWISASRATSGKLTLVEIAACVAGDRTPGSFVGAPSAPRSFSTDALLAEHRVEVAVVDTSPVDEDEIHVLVPSAADSSDAVAVEPSPHHFSPSVPASPAASFSVQAAAKRRVRLPPELVAPIIAFLKLPRDILAAGKVGRDWWTTAKIKLYENVRLPTAAHLDRFALFLERQPRLAAPMRLPSLPTAYPQKIPICGTQDRTSRPRRASKPQGPLVLRQPIGVLDFSSPLLPESFRGPTDLWNAVIRILRLLPPDGVSKILFPRAPISRLDSLAALGLAKGCELDLRGVQSPWFPAFLAALAHSMPQKVKLGDAPRVHDAPEPVRPSGLRRLFGQPVIEWTPEHHDFRHAALEASAKLVQPKDLEIEMVEMGVWWTTGNLRVLLSSWGAGLERFSVKLGKTPGTLDERDVEVRKRGPLAWLERKLFVVREGERKVGRTEDDGLQGVDSWSYGDETEFSALLSLLIEHAPRLTSLQLDLGGLVPMNVPTFVSRILQLLTRPSSRLNQVRLRVGEGVWKLLRTDGFGIVEHHHPHHSAPTRRTSLGSIHHTHHHTVWPTKNAMLQGFVGKAEKGGWYVIERR